MTASALPYYDAIPPAELAEDVLEASFARGLASAECFEVRTPPYTRTTPAHVLRTPLICMYMRVRFCMAAMQAWP